MNLTMLQEELILARPVFVAASPGIPSVLRIPRHRLAVKVAGSLWKVAKYSRRHRRGESFAEIIGAEIGGRVIGKGMGPVKAKVKRGHLVATRTQFDPLRKNGMGGRGWIDTPGRYPMVIVFHDANRVGPHVDVHIGRVSIVYNLRNKPEVLEQIRYKRDGVLADESKKAIISHVRAEIENGSRVAQNLDHSQANARATWYHGDKSAKHYGAGFSRQVVLETEVDVYKTDYGHPMHVYAPALNPHRPMYIYPLYPGVQKTWLHKDRTNRAPILIWGMNAHQPPVLEDRLHLKLIDPSDVDKLEAKADMATSTAKLDGSSCWVVITPKGTTVWSPRESVVTGDRIEYTHKLDGLASLTSETTMVAMGELVWRQRQTRWEKLTRQQPQPWFPAATGSGILNSNSLTPEDVEPMIFLYRADRVGRRNVHALEFWDNRDIQKHIAGMHDTLGVVPLMTGEQAKLHGYEGIVAAPENGSVIDGFKMKWWQDADDWCIVSVDFKAGDKGGIAGNVRAISLASNKEYYLGPGQMGDRALCERMMKQPEDYEGAVIKVQSRHGHEGRAAKVVAFHDDKGIYVPV